MQQPPNALKVLLSDERMVKLFVARLSAMEPEIPCDFAAFPNQDPAGFLLIAPDPDDIPLWELRIETLSRNSFVTRYNSRVFVRRDTVDPATHKQLPGFQR